MNSLIINSDKQIKLPKGILFDTDNTLYPYEPAHAAAQLAVKSKVTTRFSITAHDFDNAYADARNQVKDRLGATASSHSRLLYLQRMLELLGLGSQVLFALDFEQTYWRNFLAHARLFPDVIELLDDLRLLGIETAIVTDLTAQIQFRKMIYFGLDHYFDYIVTSEEAGCDKPNPAPFKLASMKMEIQSNDLWMIGDNPVNDIQGAKNSLNAFTLQKLHDGVTYGTGSGMPDVAFYDYSSLRNLIKEVANNEY